MPQKTKLDIILFYYYYYYYYYLKSKELKKNHGKNVT